MADRLPPSTRPATIGATTGVLRTPEERQGIRDGVATTLRRAGIRDVPATYPTAGDLGDIKLPDDTKRKTKRQSGRPVRR